MTVVLRKGGAQDVRFLRDMLHHAYYWRERVPGSLVSRYVRGWGRPGDTAVIALENGFPVGAAWFRVFGLEEPGYGFVDEQTQELIAKARDAGYERLSLSVEPGNPARKLYERHGFSIVDEGAEAWTMVATL